MMPAQSDSTGARFALVTARFNEFITGKLLAGALEAFSRAGVPTERIHQSWVPGSFELPLAAKTLAASGRYDAVVALGCLVRGETAHFELIAAEATRGLMQASLETGIPITFGVLTVDNAEHALERAGGRHGNKGAEAAQAAIEMVKWRASLRL
jgi:6,7-dimethyl-8-ribityllumazine synthase